MAIFLNDLPCRECILLPRCIQNMQNFEDSTSIWVCLSHECSIFDEYFEDVHKSFDSLTLVLNIFYNNIKDLVREYHEVIS